MRLTVRITALMVLMACTPTSQEPPDEGTPRREPEELPIETPSDSSVRFYSRGYSGVSEPARIVVRDTEAWGLLWARIVEPESPKPPVPPVDFTRHTLIVAAMGTRGSGGYSIRITEVKRDSGVIRASVTGYAPAPGCITSQAMTAPVDIVRIPRSELTIRFVEQTVVGSSCG